MSTLEGKTCLITGASGGLGVEIANVLGEAGCRLFLTATSTDALDAAAKRLNGTGVRVEGFMAADVAADLEVKRLTGAVLETCGNPDILVNNAGVFPVGPIESAEIPEIDRCLAVNLRSAIVLAKAFCSEMKLRGWGRIVNIASSSAYSGFPNTAAYCASKHGLLGFSRALDAELRSSGVRVLSISPGSIKTAMGRRVEGLDYETFLEPREVAEMVGHLVQLDGGMIVNEISLNRMIPR